MNSSWKLYRGLAVLVPVLTLTMVGGVATGCSTNQSATEQIDDASITASVKAKFATDDDVKAHNIDVDTVNGVVTLTGIVNSAAEKAEAARLAADVDGVRRVTNNLQIKS